MKKALVVLMALVMALGAFGSAMAEALPFEGRMLHVLGSVRRFDGEQEAWDKIAEMFKAEYGADVVWRDARAGHAERAKSAGAARGRRRLRLRLVEYVDA